MADKPVIWVGSSRADLSAHPADARQRLGFELREVQQGRMPSDWKPMSSVGAGVVEIKVEVAKRAFRLMYVAKFAEGIYVLHTFEKKSRKTSALDLAVTRARYALVRRQRREKK